LAAHYWLAVHPSRHRIVYLAKRWAVRISQPKLAATSLPRRYFLRSMVVHRDSHYHHVIHYCAAALILVLP
jgi:hypothetical protein